MKHILLISFVFLLSSNTEVESQTFAKIQGYFQSQAVQNFYNVWHKSRKGFETAVARALKESYSSSSGTLNVYVKQEINPQELCQGYYINDNIVSVLLEDVYLREMPQLLLPDVAASLAHNVIRVETRLRKMFIDANYILMRNRSDIIFKDDRDPFKSSPFALQQVQTKGHLTIIAEDCHLIGHSVVTLTGITPYVGHALFKISHCKFSIEIYHPGLPSPPVISPYFSRDQRNAFQYLLARPIGSDFAAKLQGTVVSLINTTAVFGQEMYDFRSAQKQIFNETKTYIYQAVRRLNKATIRANQGILDLPDLEVMWDDGQKEDEKDQSRIKITMVTINGLDLAYPSLRGGPIRMAKNSIEDEMRFYRLQVRGKLEYENSTMKGVYDFAVELLDVAVAIKAGDLASPRNDATEPKVNNVPIRFAVQLWRELVFLPGNFKNVIFKGMPGDTLVLGYMIQEVPQAIARHLEAMDVEAKEDEKNELDS